MSTGRQIADFFIAMYERFGLPFRKRRNDDKPKPSFVLVGPSGVGKSHISSSVAGDLAQLLSTPERTYQTRELPIGTEQGELIFFDTPGHKEGEVSRNDSLQKATTHGDYGVILVGSFGYHESVSMDRPPVKYNKVEDDWLGERRDDELSVFSTVIHRAMILKKPRIIITLVNKADLWLDEWEDVRKFYAESSYHAEATDAGVQHEIMKYCVVPRKFWELDKPTRKLDVNEARELHKRLTALLQQFITSPVKNDE